MINLVPKKWHVAFRIIILLIFSESNTYSQVNLNNGLVASYPFSNNANDATGNGHNGVVMNGIALTTDRFGNANSAYHFDGVDDYINVVDNGSFSSPTFSLALWFYSELSTDILQNLVAKKPFTNAYDAQYQFLINYPPYPGIVSNIVGDDMACNTFNITSSSYLNTGFPICSGKWIFAVATFDGSYHRIYINGVLAKEQRTSFSGMSQCSFDLRFGNWWSGDLRPFQGKMDDIRWYNRAINQDEVTALFNNYKEPGMEQLDFSFSQDACNPKNITFSNYTQDISNTVWSFGDGATQNDQQVTTHLYQDSGTYQVSFTGTVNGCRESVLKTIPISYANDKTLILTNDTTICRGSTVALRAVNKGFGYCWQPSVGLNNDTAISPVAKPDVTTTYYLTQQVTDVNLVTNGDFSAGNTGFTSEYTSEFPNSGGSQYWVANNPNAWNVNFNSCIEHTTGTGKMMMVNGSSVLGTKFWSEVITVQPNTNYAFSVWVQSLAALNPASMRFSINNVILGDNVDAGNTACQWSKFYTVWNSGNNTSATITIVNNNTIQDGNDFAIDDIFFGKIVLKQDSVTVKVTDCTTPATPSFTSADTVCVNTPVTIKNTSVGGTSYYWNFCSADINQTPEAVNLGNPGGLLQMPVFTDMVLDNGNYYVFLVNNYPGNLVRLDFGSSMLNTPTAHDLGNFNGFIPHTAEGIQVVKANGTWQAIIVGGTVLSGGTPRILKIDFGASITNLSPTATNWGNLGNMDQPIDLYLFQDNGSWYGFTVNSSNNTVTRFSFGANFNNPPNAVNLGNIGGLDYPTGIYAINDNGFWHVFITSGSDVGTVSRLDFGTSLLNSPTGVNLGSFGGLLKAPRDIYIIKDCNGIVGFAVNGLPGANDIVKLNFTGGLDNTPTASSLGNLGKLSFPHSISKLFRVGADLYSFITNVNSNTITRLKFAGCTNSSIPNSAAQNPPAVKYSTPGVYNINLLMDDGLATQATYCKQLVVLAAPAKIPTTDTSFCSGDSVRLQASSNAQTYIWSTGSKDSSIFVNNTGTYWVDAGYYGCTVRDSILTKSNTLPVANAGRDAALCIKDSVSLQASGGINYSWLPAAGLNTATVSNPKASPAATTSYVVLVTDKNGCKSRDTVTVKVNPLPTVNAGNDVTICSGSSTTLTATGGTQYTWSPVKGLSATGISNPVASPDTTTFYQVKVTDANNCTGSDSVTVAVTSKPILVIPSPDTSFCSGGSVVLNTQVRNATSIVWTPGTGLSNTGIAQPVARPTTSTGYTITVNNAGNCPASGFIQVEVLPAPVVSTSSDTVICTSGQAQLNASGGTSYSWSPATALSATDIPNPIASPTSTLYYHVQVTGSNSCTQSDSVLITVNPLPVFTITPASISICLGDTTVLTAGGGDVYSWNPGPMNTGEPSIGIVPTENTTYQVTITNNTCKVTGSLSSVVAVGALPVITLTKSNDVDCVIGQAQLTASGGTGYHWYPSTGLSNTLVANPLATPIVTTTYHVQVTGNNGCVKEDSIQVKVSNVAGVNGYQLATAFTPNADGINDCFGVRKWGAVNSLEFSVYDRWGVRVFYSNSTDNCWDGTYKGAKQPAGTFVYQVKAKTLCGDIYRKGTVVLIR